MRSYLSQLSCDWLSRSILSQFSKSPMIIVSSPCFLVVGPVVLKIQVIFFPLHSLHSIVYYYFMLCFGREYFLKFIFKHPKVFSRFIPQSENLFHEVTY